MPDNNSPWELLWLSDQVWSQTTQEMGQAGLHQQWPGWARHMIDCSRVEGHVDMSAPRVAQMAVLLSNENRRFFIQSHYQATRERMDLEEKVQQYILSLSSFDVETD